MEIKMIIKDVLQIVRDPFQDGNAHEEDLQNSQNVLSVVMEIENY